MESRPQVSGRSAVELQRVARLCLHGSTATPAAPGTLDRLEIDVRPLIEGPDVGQDLVLADVAGGDGVERAVVDMCLGQSFRVEAEQRRPALVTAKFSKIAFPVGDEA
jgi:hypothetical protein